MAALSIVQHVPRSHSKVRVILWWSAPPADDAYSLPLDYIVARGYVIARARDHVIGRARDYVIGRVRVYVIRRVRDYVIGRAYTMCQGGLHPLGCVQMWETSSVCFKTSCRWLSKVPSRSYWGLHGHQLPDVQQLVSDMLELKAATAPRHQHQHQQQQQQQGGLSMGNTGGSPGSLSRSTSATAAAAVVADTAATEVHRLVILAKTAVAGYLSKARSKAGVLLLDGIDSLLLQLLCDVGDAAAVEALVSSSSNAAVVSAAAAALRAAGRWHGLALLLMNAGQPQEALQIWKVGGLQDVKVIIRPVLSLMVI